MRISVLALGALLITSAAAQPKFLHPDRIRYDGHCFTIDGKDTFLFSGSFHYFRCPKALWRERFRAIKAAGFNAVETYVAWNWSERERPTSVSDSSHIKLDDLDAWLTMAEKEFGLYTIVRPGPYICSEWATGGYPNWLITFKPSQTRRSEWFRSDDPVFVQWSKHWFDAVAKVVTKHQLTRRAPGDHGVILWQVENEYDGAGVPEEAKRNYVRDLIKMSWAEGIDVPIFGCWTSVIRFPKGDPVLSQAFDNPNQYPRWDVESVKWALRDQHQAQPWAPKMVTEFQGGWFGQVGGLAAEEQDGVDDRQINALTLYAIQNGASGLNYYMLFGGTNFGDWAGEGITTSYDYMAPIREWGGTGAKYRSVQAIGRMLQHYGPDLARSTELDSPVVSDRPEVQVAARRGKSGATYLFVRNTARDRAVSGVLGGTIRYELGSFGMSVYRYDGELSRGTWIVHPDAPPPPAAGVSIRFHRAEVAVGDPIAWTKAPVPSTNEKLGVYDSRFIFYRAALKTLGNHSLWIRPSGGTLVTSTKMEPIWAQGGKAWTYRGAATQEFALLNPGWPNGGSGMEAPRGIAKAIVVDTLPKGVAVEGWKGRILGNDKQSPADFQEKVETTGWMTNPTNDIFKPHTTGVLRSNFRIENPDPSAVLSTEGIDDEGWFYINGHPVGEIHQWGVPATFPIGKYLHPGENSVAIVIYNNEGAGGLIGKVSVELPLPKSQPFSWQWTDKVKVGAFKPYSLDTDEALVRNVHPKIESKDRHPTCLQVRSRINFDRPVGSETWELLLDAGGDGFLTLNGQPLGRFWEVGPQRGYYLPSTMLKQHNVLELSVIPGQLGDRIKAAELRALPMRG